MKLKIVMICALLLSASAFGYNNKLQLRADNNFRITNRSGENIYVIVVDASSRSQLPNKLDVGTKKQLLPELEEETSMASMSKQLVGSSTAEQQKAINALKWLAVDGGKKESTAVSLDEPIQVAVWKKYPGNIRIDYDKNYYTSYANAGKPVISPAFFPGPQGYFYINPTRAKVVNLVWNGDKLVADNSLRAYFKSPTIFKLNIMNNDIVDLTGYVLGNPGK